MADEGELRKRVIEGQEARQTLERIEAELSELEDEWISKLKQCPSDAHDDRLMIQCQLNAIDGLRGTLVNAVRAEAGLWPALYLPSALGLLLALGALWIAGHPGWLRRLFPRRSAA